MILSREYMQSKCAQNEIELCTVRLATRSANKYRYISFRFISRVSWNQSPETHQITTYTHENTSNNLDNAHIFRLLYKIFNKR